MQCCANSVNDSGLIDIIIVNYNSSDCVLKCLASIYESLDGLSVNVFVFDNASRDDVDKIAEIFPRVRLLKNSTNIGFAGGVNEVLKKSAAPHAIIFNPDTIVHDGFFESVIAFMEKNDDVGILGPKILNPDGSVQGSARSFPSLLTVFFGRDTFLTRLFPNNPISQKNVLTLQSDGTTPMEVDWVSGACMVMCRKALEMSGFMDERFFMFWEDADLCRRIREKGWKVVYFPQAAVLHHVGQSSKTRVLGAEWNFHLSAYRLFSKYAAGNANLLKPIVALGLCARFCILAGRHLGRQLFFQNSKWMKS